MFAVLYQLGVEGWEHFDKLKSLRLLLLFFILRFEQDPREAVKLGEEAPSRS